MPYRDDRDALQARLETLQSELAHLNARARALKKILRRADAVRRGIAETEMRLGRSTIAPIAAAPPPAPARTGRVLLAVAGVGALAAAIAASLLTNVQTANAEVGPHVRMWVNASVRPAPTLYPADEMVRGFR